MMDEKQREALVRRQAVGAGLKLERLSSVGFRLIDTGTGKEMARRMTLDEIIELLKLVCD